MPRYQVTLPNGRTMVLEGDHPPTLEEAQAQFDAAVKSPPPPDHYPDAPSSGQFLKNAGKDVVDIAGGAVDALAHPIDALTNLPSALKDRAMAYYNDMDPRAAAESAKQGKYAQAYGQLLPVGVAYNNPVQTYLDMNAGAGAAKAAEAVAPKIISAAPGVAMAAGKAGLIGGAYYLGREAGANPEILGMMGLGAAGKMFANDIKGMFTKAPTIEDAARSVRPPPIKEGQPLGSPFYTGEEPNLVVPPPPLKPITPDAPAPRITGIKQVPLSPNTRSSWPSGEPPVPQQTSSIKPTSNAFVNLDEPQPLPSDNPSGYHTETTGKGTGERMQSAHKIIKAEDANYQGAVADLKATVGPDFLKALLDSLNRGGR